MAVVNVLADMPSTVSGGVLGFFCSHEYAHTHGVPPVRLPSSLKGVDMALYATFRALGLEIEILPIMAFPDPNRRRPPRLSFGGLTLESSDRRRSLPANLREYKKNGYVTTKRYGWGPEEHRKDYDLNLMYEVGESPISDDEEIPLHEATSLDDYKDVETRFQSILRKRKIKGLSAASKKVVVGKTLHAWVDGDDLERESEKEV